MAAENAGSIYSEVDVRLDKVQQDLNLLVTRFQQFGKKLDTVTSDAGDKIEKNIQKPLVNIQTVAIGASAAIALAFKSILGVYTQTQQSLSNVQAATKASAAEMAQLEKAAVSAGQELGVSMGQSLDAIEALSKAGVTNADIMGGALPGALELAAAGNLAVADAAEIASATMTQFGLAGKDVTHIADLLAAGAGKAQGEVSDLSMALKQAGLVASQTGLSVEDTVGALAAFASAGLLGSDAGTSFRTMLLRLTPQSKEAADKMEELGIKAFDANGEFVGLAKYAQILQNRLGGLTTEQRNSALATVFGSDSIRAANILYTQGSKGIEEWTAKVNDSGYAAEIARVRMDNLNGDLTKLGASAANAANKIGTSLDPVLRGAAQGGRSLLDFITSLDEKLLAFASTAVLVAGGIFGIGGALGALGLSVAALFGPIGLIVAGVTALTAGLVSMGIEADNLRKKDIKTTFESIGTASGKTGADLDKFLETTRKVEDRLVILSKQGTRLSAEGFKKLAASAGLTNDELAQIALRSEKVGQSVKTVALGFVDAARETNEFMKRQQETWAAMDAYYGKKYPTTVKKAVKGTQEDATALTKGELEAQIFVYENAQNRIADIISERRTSAAETAIKEAEDQQTLIDEYASAQATIRDIIELRMHETAKASEVSLADQLKGIKAYADIAFSIYEGLFKVIGELFSSMNDSQLADLEYRYQKERELIENNGLTKEQVLQKELDDALAAGDTEKAADAKKELDLFNLEKDFTKKKADLQYQAAMAQWGIQVALATAQAAQGALNAFVSSAMAGPVGLAAAPGAASLAALFGGLQVAAVAASMPQPPKFATGGIVLPSGQGGTQVTVADGGGGGEVMFGTGALGAPLMEGFMDGVADRVLSRLSAMGKPVNMVVDGKTLTQIVVKYIDGGDVYMRSLKR